MLKVAEVGVVTFAFSRQQCMKGMMKIVIPLSVQAISAQLRWPDNACIVERAFGDYVHSPGQRRALRVHAFSKCFGKFQCRVVQNGMECIEPEGIGVILGKAAEGGWNKEV